MPQYVKPRGTVYHFSRRAPQPLLPGTPLLLDDRQVVVQKNGYIRFSLGLSDKKAAAAAGRKYAHLIDMAASQVQAPRPQQKPALQSAPSEGFQRLENGNLQFNVTRAPTRVATPDDIMTAAKFNVAPRMGFKPTVVMTAYVPDAQDERGYALDHQARVRHAVSKAVGETF